MRFRRIIALLCAAIYITTAGAAAAELPEQTALPETVQAEQEAAPESEPAAAAAALTAEDTELPVARTGSIRVVPSTHNVRVNGELVSPQAYNIDGYNYFKLRDVAYLLNGTTSSFNVTWDSAQDAVNLISGESYTSVGGEMTVAAATTLRVQESTAKVLLDGNGIVIKGYNINGNNYYKIADVSSAIGFTAAYESATKTVQILTPSAPEPEPEPDPEQPEEEFVTGIYQVHVDTSLSIRSGPGTTYPAIGRLSNGDRIVVDSISDG